MEIAKLIIEFVKALAWPIVVLILVLRFHKALSKILAGLSDRFRTADKLKLGLMGQEVELSGTAQVLLQQKDELLRQANNQVGANIEAAQIQQSAQQLNNPLADIIGTALLRSRSHGLMLEEIVQAIFATFSPQGSNRAQEPQSYVLIAMADQAEKCIEAMVAAGLAAREGDRVALTDKGVEVFEKVAQKQSTFLKRFQTLRK